VYNLASASFVPESWEHPVLTAQLSAVGVTSMLEAIRQVDPAIRFYQASSSEIFGEPPVVPQDESTPLTPHGVAKAYGHLIVGSCRRRYGLLSAPRSSTTMNPGVARSRSYRERSRGTRRQSAPGSSPS
jgi:GDPmannose 4,6-dehydratase